MYISTPMYVYPSHRQDVAQGQFLNCVKLLLNSEFFFSPSLLAKEYSPI